MKNYIFVLAGLVTLAAPAFADDQADCVKAMRSPSISDEEAVYACDNMWLEHRDSDTPAQEEMRQKLAREAAEAREETLRAYHQEQGD